MTKTYKFCKLSLLFVLVIAVCNCSARKLQNGVSIDSVRKSGIPAGQTVRVVEVSRKAFQAAIARGGDVNRLRMVPVFRGPQDSAGTSLPEYRLFDVRPHSVFALVKLEEADILVAAHNFIVYEANSFPTYVLKFLPELADASIEVRRMGAPLLLQYKFIE